MKFTKKKTSLISTKALSKTLLLAIIFTSSFTNKTIAQDVDKCHTILSLFIEPAKAKSYDVAITHYDNVIKECPTFSLATYQYGVKMFKHFVKSGDKSKVNDLIKAYETQLELYPSKTKVGKTLGLIAQAKYDNKIGTKMNQFNAFDEAFNKDEATFTSPKSLYTYFSLAKDLFDSGEKDIQEVFNLYDVVYGKIEKEEIKLATIFTGLLNKQEAGETLTKKEEKKLKACETNLKAYGTIKGSVDGKLGKMADCPNLIPLYERDFESKKNDVTWLRRSAGRLNSRDCETPLFFKMVQQLHNLEPSAKSAFYLGRLADREGNSSSALDYYNQAAELETSPTDKAKYYFYIAENFKKKGSFGQARTYYRKALENKPSYGRCYLRIASMYAQSSNSCGSTVFEKRAVNWLAAQMADKAARVDASIASNARAAASTYRQRAPSKSDIFSEDMAGKTVSFRCWIGGSVKVPNL